MVELDILRTDLYEVTHLQKADLSKLETFETKPEGKGLQIYLQKYAYKDETCGCARTYLVKDVISGDLVAYFTLRTGLITVSRGFLKGFDARTGIELANFAINESYRNANEVIPRLGSYIFERFIIPIVMQIREGIGAEILYIYALPNDKLMAHYETMGFSKAPKAIEKCVYRHVKPVYDQGCRFMFQILG